MSGRLKMKRSEMAEIIKLALKTWNAAYYDASLESHILSELEEAGMLPPAQDTQYEVDKAKSTITVHSHYENFDPAKGHMLWEPEV